MLIDLFYESAFFEKYFDISALNLLHDNLEKLFFLEGELDIGYRLLIYGIVAGTQKLADIVFAAPDLGNAAVDIEQCID